MKDIIGIGALNLDLVYEVDDLATLRKGGWPLHPGRETSLPEEDFQQLLQELRTSGVLRSRSGGGSAANTICALAGMGFKTGFVGRVGADEEGALILGDMAGVDLSPVKAGGVSGICLVVLDRHRDRALVVQPNANDDLCREDLDLRYLAESHYLHLSAFVGDGPFDVQRQLMALLPPEVRAQATGPACSRPRQRDVPRFAGVWPRSPGGGKGLRPPGMGHGPDDRLAQQGRIGAPVVDGPAASCFVVVL